MKTLLNTMKGKKSRLADAPECEEELSQSPRNSSIEHWYVMETILWSQEYQL